MKLATFVDPSTVLGSRLLVAFVKGPTLLLRMIVVALIFFMVRRLTRDPGVARSVALAYWLNPALILNGPALGYLDPLCSIPGLFAIIAAANGWAASAGVLAAVSLLIKPQGLFFILPVAAVLWRARDFGFLRAVLNGAVIWTLTVLPFLLAAPASFLAAAQVNLTEDFLSADAMNVWWIIGGAGMLAAHGWSALSGRLPTLSLTVFADYAGFNPRLLTTAFVIGVALWAFWQVRGRRDAGLAAAMCAFVFHVYFVFAVNVHENHLVYAIPLVGLAALTEARYWRLYLGLSAFVFVNLVVFYGLGRDFTGMDRVRWFWPVSMVGSAAGIALLWYHFQMFRSLIAKHKNTPPI